MLLGNTTGLPALFFKFITVGAFGFAIDMGVTWLVKEKLKFNKYVANSLGFVCGLTFNYFGNRTFTFQSHDPDIALQYLKFAAVGVSGLLLVNSLIYVFHDKAGIPFFVAKVLAMLVFMFWNFGANYLWTFA